MVAGTNEDILFWDVRNLKQPLEVLDESHSDDITSIRFDPKDFQSIITCSTDNLVNVFNFEGKASMKEDDSICQTYCSE